MVLLHGMKNRGKNIRQSKDAYDFLVSGHKQRQMGTMEKLGDSIFKRGVFIHIFAGSRRGHKIFNRHIRRLGANLFQTATRKPALCLYVTYKPRGESELMQLMNGCCLSIIIDSDQGF